MIKGWKLPTRNIAASNYSDIFQFILVAIFFGQSFAVRATELESLCKRTEKVYFSCSIKGGEKIVSLCGSKELRDSDKNYGYLQYRFGQVDNLELEFPKALGKGIRKFKYAEYHRFQVERVELGN